jgi:MFS superfamily sulfate permease-like transporter
MAKDCCVPHGKIMDYIKNNRFAIGIVCMAIISLVMLTREASWSAETSLKLNADTDVSRKKVKDNQTSDNKDHKVIIFYFYGNVRCFTCKRIERLTKEAVKEEFGKEMKNGVVEMKAINVQEPRNNHFIKDYRLYTKSVIVSDLIQGKEERWKNLQRVWELVRNDEAFKRYVQKEVKEYLQGKQS